jgi:DNA-binding transcriptional regulator YbjK
MPQNPERRTQILDTAIAILADSGVAGVNHRKIDQRADLPPGTTTNYFRTRQALLEATAARTVELHWQRVNALVAAAGPLTRDGVRSVMIRMLTPDDETRRFTLARFELFLEGTRRPELQPFLHELQAGLVKSASVLFESAGLDPTPDEVDQLSALLSGHVFSSLTLPGRARPDETVDRLLRAFFDG